MSVAISPSSISFLITSAAERPSDSATSFTVAPDLICVAGSSLTSLGLGGQVGFDPRGAAAAAAAAARRLLRGRRRALAPGGLGVDDHAPAASTGDRPAGLALASRACGPWAPLTATGVGLLGLGAVVGGLGAVGFRLRGLGRLVLGRLLLGGLPLGLLRPCRLRRAGFASAFGFPLAAFLAAASPPLDASPNARATSASSTLEAAALTSKPAAWSLASTSLLVMSRSLAISWTRFFAIPI